MEPKYAIGTRFTPVGRRHPRERTVIDIWKTYNAAGELVNIRYVATHEFMGQVLTDYDVGETTIARGIK